MSFWKLINNEYGYIGKAKKAAWANQKRIADQEAAVIREQIASQERLAAEATAAQLQASRDAALGGIIGAALGANTTTEETKQILPHESGAAAMMSYDLAQKWNTTREMKESGYSNVAIEYALSGKSGKTLYKDAEMNSLMMNRDVKQMTIQSIQAFGIRSASNPYGVDITAEQWQKLHSAKDPEALLNVDPEVARQRQGAMDQWEADMIARGQGILVDIYKNPQLGGSNILAMKGKSALIPPELLPMVQSVAGGNPGTGGGTDWDAAIRAMSTGETNAMSGQIKWAMDNGLIDKYGQINAGTVMSMIPPELQSGPEFNPYRELSDSEKTILQDDYMKFSQMQIDPKLLKQESLGMGVTRQYKFNADGSVAGTMMSGYMTNAKGEQVQVAMPGDRLQEWEDMKGKMNGTVGFRAPVTKDQLNMTFEADFYGNNAFAQSNGGNKGQYTGQGPSPMPKMPSVLPAPKPPTNTNAAAPVQGATPTNTMPEGFSGAPLAAGE